MPERKPYPIILAITILILFAIRSEIAFTEGIVSPIQNLYYHVSDDDGMKPSKDTDAILLFKPNGHALIYVEEKSDHMSIKGTWSFKSGQLSLKFSSVDLQVNVTFPINLQKDELVMPFRLFSSVKGTSRWRQRSCIGILEIAGRYVFRGEVLTQEEKINTDTAIAHVVDFANAVIQIGKKRAGIPIPGLAHASDPTSRSTSTNNNLPNGVRALKNGFEVEYEDGTKIEVLLFSWAPPPSGTLKLTPKYLVRDPRVHLNAKPTNDTRFDPDNKSALLISPLHTGRIISWFDTIFFDSRNKGIVPKAVTEGFPWDQIRSRLAERGYKIEQLKDERVTVKNLIKTLVNLKNPGIVIILTHGLSDGSLSTGDQLTETSNKEEAMQKFKKLKEDLINSGHRKLVENDGVGLISVELDLKAEKDSAYFVAIKPYFWFYLQWVLGRVSFNKTLFYLGACYTDHTEKLRESINAKAYFAWKASVHPDLNGAFLHFLIESLARYTHSAEEAYYNLVRVVNTREIIRKEDKILQGKVPVAKVSEVQSPIFPKNLDNYLFNGYGLDGKSWKLVRYAGNGWLAPDEVNVGQVWWLVFAGRWGQDAKKGAENLKDCFEKFWSKKDKEHGRLKSPFCNAANIGKIPRKTEVAYACYLLTGDDPEGYRGTVVPRWTLNEK